MECGAVDGVKEERNWSWLVRCSWQDEELMGKVEEQVGKKMLQFG